MRRTSVYLCLGTALLCCWPAVAPAGDPVGTAFTYQGQLYDGDNPANGDYDLVFEVYDVSSGGVALASDTHNAVPVVDGLFTVKLDFGAGIFAGEARWLAITVNGTPLDPRQELTPAPYAMYALTSPGGSGYWAASGNHIHNTNTGNVGIGATNPGAKLHVYSDDSDAKILVQTADAAFRHAEIEFRGPGGQRYVTGWDAVPAIFRIYSGTQNRNILSIKDADGSVGIDGDVGIGTITPQARLHVTGTPGLDGIMFPDGTLQTTAATGGSNSWSLTGNAGTTPGTHFLGTTDDVALELHVNGSRALRIEPAVDEVGMPCPNVIGGYAGNSVTAGAYGATIGGGGGWELEEWVNQVTADLGTVCGGYGNVAGYAAFLGGGFGNEASGAISCIGGGIYNEASAEESYIGGGYTNEASGTLSFVGCGSYNDAAGNVATVGGGYGNTASGVSSTVPGGWNNTAAGDYSFAAGRRARANHDGTFVWADSTDADFPSTGPDQFLIRASGGVGIGTTTPRYALEVSGSIISSGPNGGGFSLRNPQNDSASFSLGWVNDQARIRIGGAGAGSGNGIDIQGTSDNSLMKIESGGNVGIGTTSPGSFRLAVNGDAAKPGGGSWSVFSDSRLKRKLTPLSGALDRLLALRGYEFEFTSEAIEGRFGLPGRQIGLIAQDVERVFPDWVDEDAEGYKYVTERGTTALLVEALRDLRNEKDAQIEAQKQQIAELTARMQRLEALLTDVAVSGNGGAQ